MSARGWMLALVLVVVTNAVVLGMAAWNRSGSPDATIEMTEREMPLSYWGGEGRENTGMSLRLQLHPDGYTPSWLDAAKLRELGFRVPDTITSGIESDKRWKTRLPRFAWVVLEYDGPAWASVLEEQQQQIERARAAESATQESLEYLTRQLERTRRSESRLVAVDAGQDAAALRARYPDTSRYLVVGAEIRVWTWRPPAADDDAPSQVRGQLRPSIVELHVPLPHRATLQSIPDTRAQRARVLEQGWAPRYRVRLNYGKRHEPWLVGVEAL